MPYFAELTCCTFFLKLRDTLKVEMGETEEIGRETERGGETEMERETHREKTLFR